MGTALAHMLRADAAAPETPGSLPGPPADQRSESWPPENRAGPRRRRLESDPDRSADRGRAGPAPGPLHGREITRPGPRPAPAQMEQARIVARGLAAAGTPVSRRALRSGGITGSNAALTALARMINAEQ